jgi:hypothetical protein
MKGDRVSRASRRAISVFPTPVGPIIRMFLGSTSCRIASGSRCRRMRLRRATATARLAPSCPTMYSSSRLTTWAGRSSSSAAGAAPADGAASAAAGSPPSPSAAGVSAAGVSAAARDAAASAASRSARAAGVGGVSPSG